MPERSSFGWAVEGARQAIMGPAWIVIFSLVSVGGLARDAGFSQGVAIASTLLMWAGPAQVLYFGAFAAGVPAAVVALSVSLSSVRLLPMTVSLLPMLRREGTRTSTLLMAAHFVAVTVWVESMRRLPGVPREKRLPFFFGFAGVGLVCTTISTAFGYTLVGLLSTGFAAGLLFMTPIYFTAALVRNARLPIDWLALTFGLGLAPVVAAFVGGGFDLLVLGLVGGTAAWAIQRFLDARRAEGRSA